jgi:hypothetical protein
LTEHCVKFIRGLAETPATAEEAGSDNPFDIVAATFLKIGHPTRRRGAINYPPETCPTIAEVAAIAEPATGRAPV